MKHTLLILLCTVFSFTLYSQDSKPKVHTIISERVIKLNGGARANLGGAFGATSRTYLEIALPPNTIEWHYSFSTCKDGATVAKLNLGMQLGSLLLNFAPAGIIFSGLAKEAISHITVPQGAMPINSYIVDGDNLNKFINKKQFSYLDGTSMLNTMQGETQIANPNSGTYYLALQNISSLSAVIVKVEVVAIVSE